jgi:glycosyltransferase involved in cell wall biosynthesis
MGIYMNIASVSSTFPPNFCGTGLVCHHNATGLSRLGHSITVYTANYPKENYIEPDGYLIHRLPILFRIGNAPFLPTLLTIQKYDLIHLHHPFIFGSEMVWFSSQLRKIPYLITHHNDLIAPGLRGILFNAYSTLVTPRIFDRARKIVLVSLDHALSGKLSHLIWKYHSKVVEIPNGVDTNLFRPDLEAGSVRQHLGISDRQKILLFVGALDSAHHYRRVDLLIEAVHRTHDPNLQLIIAGSGNNLPVYKQLSLSLDLGSQVHFIGKIANRELPLIYSASDVVVLPSFVQEAFPLVLLEAMACGKPFIASNLPGVRSMVDNENGLLVKPGDAIDLAEKISEILHDPGRQKEMGVRGRLKVEKDYSWEKINKRLEQTYQDVLASS